MSKAEKVATPQQLFEAKLAESGLTVKDARVLRMDVLPAKRVVNLDPMFKPYPGLRLPYFCTDGKLTGFYRLRYLGEMNGFDAMRKKQMRYVQPADTMSEVYLPPLVDWKTITKDISTALFITEGELKAACASKAGFPTIGLGGVWSWKSARKGVGLLPVFEDFTWKGRSVYLVFDSDYATNPDVMRALVGLAKELAARGAQPYLVSLPELPELIEKNKKTGLDDFLVARGKDDFEQLIIDATPFNTSQELWQLNSEIVYIRDPGLIIVLADGRKLSPAAFKEHAYANRHYYETKVNQKGDSTIAKKPVAPAWLQWECRAELARLTYKPGKPRVTSEGEYNYWPGWGTEPRKGDITLWRQLLDYIFAKDAAARMWFERWCAFPVQHPGAKLYAASVLWGRTHGTGKSLIGYSLGKIYGRNFTEISDEDLGGTFNEWAENKQFVMGDDVTGAEFKKSTMELLKFMITRQKLRVNAKYLPSYEVPDCINYYFTSNTPDAFLLDDTDRRYFIWQMPDDPLPREFYDTYDAWIHEKDGKLGGPGALLYHLQHLDLANFNPREHAMLTEAKQRMILDGKSDIGVWCSKLNESPDMMLMHGTSVMKSDLYTNEQLLMLYDPANNKRVTANGLGRELKKAGFHQVNGGAVVMTAKGPQRLYAIRNSKKWINSKPVECGKHWNTFFAAALNDKKEKF